MKFKTTNGAARTAKTIVGSVRKSSDLIARAKRNGVSPSEYVEALVRRDRDRALGAAHDAKSIAINSEIFADPHYRRAVIDVRANPGPLRSWSVRPGTARKLNQVARLISKREGMTMVAARTVVLTAAIRRLFTS